MTKTTHGEVTRLLAELREGDRGALDRLLPRVYGELHALAHGQLRKGRPGETVNTTALVHETYLKLVDAAHADWSDRSHFMAVAALAMRQILVDYARRRGARKRGGDLHRVELDEEHLGVAVEVEEILAVDEALSALDEIDERLARLVEMRFFGGMTLEEAGEVLGLSERTMKRDWRRARAFLYRALGERGGDAVAADG